MKTQLTTKSVTNKLTPFENQIINDLWETYMYSIQQVNPDREKYVANPDPDDVGYFREWLDNENIIAFEKFLPQSDSQLAEVIKYCYQHSTH